MEPKPPPLPVTLTPADEVIAPEDLALVRAATAGDRLAMEQIQHRMKCVSRFLAAHNEQLGRPLDGSELDDVSQEVIILVWRKLPEFAGRATLESWIFRFCQLEVFAHLRRRPRLPTLDPDSRIPEPIVQDEPKDFIAIEKVLRLLEELPDETRHIVRLKHFAELTFEEIAERLGTSPNTVKTVYYRALIRLRGRFRDDDEKYGREST